MTKLAGILAVFAAVAALLVGSGIIVYKKGYAAAEAVYQQKATAATIVKVENTEKLEAEKEKLKQREKNLNDDCKAIYNIDLRACRLQLRGER
jgi:cell division protein FtsB